MKIEKKIINHYKNNYASSPIDITKEEIDFIIKNKCKCDYCDKSIFDLDDFPNIDIENNELLCEDCYDDEYRELCPLCEDSYDTKDMPKEFPKDPFYYIGSESKCGFYHAIEYPVFRAAIGGLGPTYIYWDHVEFLCSIEDYLNEFDKKRESELNDLFEEYNNNNSYECAEFICDSCYANALSIKNKK